MWCYGSSEAAMAGYDQKSEIADVATLASQKRKTSAALACAASSDQRD